MIPNWPPEIWLSCAITVATVGSLIVTYRMLQLQKSVEGARQYIDIAIKLRQGAWDQDGIPLDDQYRIDVINSSPTGVRIEAITITGVRPGFPTQELTGKQHELVNPFGTRTINIYWMTEVTRPLAPEHNYGNGSIAIVLKYKAYGKTAMTEPFEFSGQFGNGYFHEG